MLRLETDRLILRPVELIDAARIRLLASDYTVAAMTLTTPHPYPEGAAEAFVAQAQEQMASGNSYTFAVIGQSEGTLVGLIGLHPTPAHHRAELGYWMGVEYRGGGYMTEAVRRVIRFGFEELELSRIYAACFAENAASERVMQKSGMKLEGKLRNHFMRFGNFHDGLYYGLLRDEWQEVP